MTTRNIAFVIAPGQPHFVGDGFRVNTFIPSGRHMDMKRMDPFIMLDYNPRHYFPPTEQPRGVGVHPHKGFETVTIAYKGKVAHHDSTGSGGVIGEGDVQWMTAASGILHKEYHEEHFSKQGGDFQMVQLWVNLPARAKQSPPRYQAIRNMEMSKVEVPGNGGLVEVIAGKYQGQEGSASTFTPINLFNAKLKQRTKAEFSFPENHNTALLVIEGKVTINASDEVPTDHFALMENDGERFSIQADEAATVLLMSGQPIDEPIAAQGPFVMNTEEELKAAFDEFKKGEFGYLA